MAVVLDLSIAFVLAVVGVIIVTGGGTFELLNVRIRAQTVESPLLVGTALLLLRYSLHRHRLRDATDSSMFGRLLASTRKAVFQSLPAWGQRGFSRPALPLLAVCLMAFATKATLAWALPGFFSGDDVEIHEMTIGALHHAAWPVWELRSPFFPMGFVYPVQRIVFDSGGTSPEVLVFAGRAVVAMLSTLAIPLTWVAARRLSPSEPLFAVVAASLVAVNKLQMSFGSSELPRPVATVFVLAAFVTLLRRGVTSGVVAGALLGMAAAFRFSELIFLPVAVAMLALRRYRSGSVILALSATVTFLAVNGVSDCHWPPRADCCALSPGYRMKPGITGRVGGPVTCLRHWWCSPCCMKPEGGG